MTALSQRRARRATSVKRRPRTVHYRHDVPHSSYLVTLVAGEYAHLEERAGDVELHYFVDPGPRGRRAAHVRQHRRR